MLTINKRSKRLNPTEETKTSVSVSASASASPGEGGMEGWIFVHSGRASDGSRDLLF